MAQQIVNLQAESHAKKDKSETISKQNSSDENNDKDQMKTPPVKTKMKEKKQLNCENCE